MIHNLMDKIEQRFGLAATVSADVDTAVIDTQDLSSLAFLVSVAAFTFTGVNKIALRIKHSDDNVTFSEATLADNDLYVEVPELITAGDGAKTHKVEYRGLKRYVKMTLDVSGTVSVAAAVCAIGKSKDMPADSTISLA
jgi:hypothetical protein